MHRFFIAITCIVATVSCTHKPMGDSVDIAGITFIEAVSDDQQGIVIPYKKYRLANGLTVVLHEDNSDPLVHVDVTYHVGSAREEARRSGFAHFFEHMMFQGSKHVGDDEHFKIITESGGRMNGTTNNDRTNYFQTVPANYLETALWLESDRMGFLLEAVTQEKFEVQRATVKNERGQNYDNRPYGLFNELNNAALYPPDHPYSWPVIGYVEDLDAATVEDLKKFLLRWYGPNNATLTIGGQLDIEKTLQLVNKYFGAIPAGPDVEKDYQEPVKLSQDRYVSYVDKNIRFPALLFTYPTVPSGHEDEDALQCLANIVGQGRKSYLYKQFVLNRKAIEASAFSSFMELGGSMTFFVLPFPGVSLSDFEKEMRQLLEGFNADSITEEDVQICRASSEAGLVRSLTSVQGKVSRLAYYETFFADPNRVQEEVKRIRALTKADVLAAFNQYIKNGAAVVQSVVPTNDPNGQARPDNFTLPERPQRVASETDNLQPRPVIDQVDRTSKPKAGPAPLVEVPDYYQSTFGNGIELIATQDSEVPLVTLQLEFEGGHLLESDDEYGLASLSAALMNEGTENFSAEAFEKELSKLGSQISVGSGTESTIIYISSLTDRLDETLSLLEERLFRNRFTDEDLQRIRKQTIENIEANKEQPSAIASDVYRTLLYGDAHPLSVSSEGIPQTLANIQLQDVKNHAAAALAQDNLEAVVVGDIDPAAIQQKLSFLTKLPTQAPKQVSLPASSQKTLKLYLVDKPGAHQSEIRIGYLTDLTYSATGEYFKRYLMNYVLGGAFNSRINMNLREDKGYTYGARSGFRGTKLPGPFTASASVKKEATADSVRQFMKEITDYRNKGITEEELAFMRSAIGQSDALSYETPRQKAGFLGDIIKYNLDENFVEQQMSIINSITQEEINSLAKKHLPIESMFILVVGDNAEVLPSLQELGYDIELLTAEGEPVNE